MNILICHIIHSASDFLENRGQGAEAATQLSLVANMTSKNQQPEKAVSGSSKGPAISNFFERGRRGIVMRGRSDME